MNNKRRSFTFILFVFAVLVIPILSVPTNAQSTKPSAAKGTRTEKLLKESKLTYDPFQNQNSFIISYAGKEIKQVDVIVIEVGTGILVFADAAAGADIELTPEKMRKLLEYNTNVDYIKVGISDIGSVRVQSEQDLSLLNAKAFSEILVQVASGTDEVAKIIGPIKQKTVAK